ncbi:glutamate-cysteine ligase catalytic subunit [Babesia caballi]|uniref:Glutamate-cysteine ligase catalytic subunit n=1 Tax=Babesia caballi TaxID=5871 RepID=A0AAV4LWY3_BABCB|nr:glutamate-cysteine ligase catalytic subunit [Babesia caballi]
MKISFGLAGGAAKKPANARVAPPTTSQFFDSDAPAAPALKRVKVSEMSNGRLRAATDPDGSGVLQAVANADGHRVIPCANRLDEAPARPKERRSAPRTAPVELQYGLNVLKITQSNTGTADSAEPTEPATDTSNARADERSHGCEDSTLNRRLSNTSCSGVASSASAADKGESRDGAAPDSPSDRGGATPATDSHVAKIILHDLEQQKLREKLFGADLVEQAAKTAPILLRGKDERQRESHSIDTDDAPSYERVAVEQFGLAMLLGMGFNPKTNTNRPKEYKRRAYERAGLGADAHMKQNMETLTNASAMAKLKKDQMYHHAHEPQAAPGAVSTWVSPGLYVRIVESGHACYGQKGVVTSVEGGAATLTIHEAPVRVSLRGVESVVSLDATRCKVVRQIARHGEKLYVPAGTVVEVSNVTKSYAKIRFREQIFSVSLDDICEFR